MAPADATPQDLHALLRELRSRVPVDAAALLAQEPPERIEAALRFLPPDFANRVAAHLPDAVEAAETTAAPGTVAELMEPVRGALPRETTVAEAINWLTHEPEVGDITYLYVVDGQQRLTGMVVMRDLLLAAARQTLEEIMIHHPYRLRPEDALVDTVKAVVKRHYPVYPVCDAQGVLIGLVRGWKLFERQAIEISAQTGAMVGIGKGERVDTPLLEALRRRHPWLQLNLLTAFLAGFVVSLFESTIAQAVALAAFLPVLAGQSGNSGCQTLAITLRGLTLGDLEHFPVRRLLRKEILLGLINGALTGLFAAAAMWWTAGGQGNPQALQLALVILLAMTLACMVSGFFGVMVPLALRRLGADPATASSIFLTTGTNVAGMGVMLLLASWLVL
ncbi:MAG: magnesium transporter [Gammaproteobacteria bacterium]